MDLNKNVLEVIDLNIKNNRKDEFFLISNLNFSLETTKTYAFYFNNKNEKNAFTSFFQGKSILHSGLIKIGNKILNPFNNEFLQNFSFHNLSLFDNIDSKTRVIEVIEKEVLKYQMEAIVSTIEKNNKYDKNIKILKSYRQKKIELSYFRTVNILLKKAINQIRFINYDFKNISSDNYDDIQKIYEEFIYSHIKYLKSRINLVIEKNIMFVDLYNKKISKKIDNKKYNEINDKVKSLINKTLVYEKYSKSLTKIKKEALNILNIDKIENSKSEKKLIFNKNAIDAFLLELDFKNDFYENKLMKLEYQYKFSIEHLNCFARYEVTNRFFKIIRKNHAKFSLIENESILILINELNKKYVELLKIMEDENLYNEEANKNLRKFRKIIINLVDKELKLIINNYNKVNTSNNKNDVVINFSLLKSQNQNEILSNIESIKIEYQNLLDEINWENKSEFYQLSDDLENILELISKEISEYKKNKIFYNNLIDSFLEEKNNFIQNIKLSSEIKKQKLSDELFRSEAEKFEIIYKFVSNDSDVLSELFSKPKIKISKPQQMIEVISISRYLLFKVSKKINISIFDFLKRIGKIDNVLKNSFFLIIGMLNNKQITLYENLFSNLNYNDYKEFLKIYKKLTLSSTKKWILIESNILCIKDVADYTSIIDYSKQIEFGKTEKIFANPIYDVSIEAFGLKPFGNRKTPKIFNEFIDYNREYDYYELESGHNVYGNVNNIYEWTNIIPHSTYQTFSNESSNNLKNKIAFEKISNKNKKKIVDETKQDSSIEIKEFLIVDVT